MNEGIVILVALGAFYLWEKRNENKLIPLHNAIPVNTLHPPSEFGYSLPVDQSTASVCSHCGINSANGDPMFFQAWLATKDIELNDGAKMWASQWQNANDQTRAQNVWNFYSQTYKCWPSLF